MAKKPAKRKKTGSKSEIKTSSPPKMTSHGGRVVYGGSDVHLRFQARVEALLEDADISDIDRQRILTGMSCPCCGGSGSSFTISLDIKE